MIERRGVAALIAATIVSIAAAHADVPVTIRLLQLQQIKAEVAGSITLRAAMGPANHITVPCCEPSQEIRVPPNTAWEVIPALKNAWVARQVFAVGSTAKDVPLNLWPTGRINGRLDLEPGSPKVTKMSVRLWSPPGWPGDFPSGETVDCDLGDALTWSCELPASTLDLSFQAPGFVPQQRWGVPLGAGQQQYLGALKLRRGASVSGWVQLQGGSVKAGVGSAAIVRTVTALGPTSTRLARPVAESPIAKNGFFQLVGVPPGQYGVVVQYPGYAPETVLPVRVFPGREASIRRPILLHRPIDLTLTLTPPVDWRAQPWRVHVSRSSALSGSFDAPPIYEGQAVDGIVKILGQSPGRYSVNVVDSAGNSFKDDFFTVSSAEDAAQTIDLPIIRVRGDVKRGDEPIEAMLWFGGRHGAEHVVLRSDNKGDFHGVLPHPGRWRVTVALPGHDAEIAASVHARENDAEVHLRLPNNSLTGIVTDHAGNPAESADVTLLTTHSSMTRATGSDGRFEFRSIEPGNLSLAATRERGPLAEASRPSTLALSEDGNVASVQLVLEPAQRLTGTVISPRGPIAGAQLSVRPADLDQAAGSAAATDLDGHFEVQIMGETPHAYVTVRPPGLPLRVFDVPLPNHAVNLVVPEVGGTLDLVFPHAEDTATLVYQDNRPLGLNDLFMWAMSHGTWSPKTDGFHLEDMAPGEYRACSGPLLLGRQRDLPGWLQSATCAAGYLAPFGNLRLDTSKYQPSSSP